MPSQPGAAVLARMLQEIRQLHLYRNFEVERAAFCPSTGYVRSYRFVNKCTNSFVICYFHYPSMFWNMQHMRTGPLFKYITCEFSILLPVYARIGAILSTS
ncbi:hypothetical protein KC19_9G070800 [Ceratodon purpureus]|uniref:Uncharacterized protein n=1 Tax=Ceratodon purpureus TaxID=3225 RepID=A0A8T0GRB1_CERPU|nr:hypothetical protein KC19_9G070800 [Ceratodon purpureus]